MRDLNPSHKTEDPKVLQAYPDSKLDESAEKWRGLIASGGTNPDHIISKIVSKYTLTPEQEERIRALAPIEGEATNESA